MSNPRLREIHRESIKQLAIASADRQWEGVVSLFAPSFICIGAGLDFCFSIEVGECRYGRFFLIVGAILFLLYRLMLGFLRERGRIGEWLKLPEQTVLAVIMLSIVPIGHIHWLAPYVMIVLGGGYAWKRLRENARPFWRSYFFREARSYLRNIRNIRKG